jgi:hypothetical protein
MVSLRHLIFVAYLYAALAIELPLKSQCITSAKDNGICKSLFSCGPVMAQLRSGTYFKYPPVVCSTIQLTVCCPEPRPPPPPPSTPPLILMTTVPPPAKVIPSKNLRISERSK